MNRIVYKGTLVQIATLGLLVLASGCAYGPSIHDVVGTISAVPVGANRDNVRKALLDCYSKLPHESRRQYELIRPAKELTKEIIYSDRNSFDYYSRVGCFTYLHPADFLEGLSPGGYVDRISALKESFWGRHASIDIYYDPSNNYLGFTAVSDRKVRRN